MHLVESWGGAIGRYVFVNKLNELNSNLHLGPKNLNAVLSRRVEHHSRVADTAGSLSHLIVRVYPHKREVRAAARRKGVRAEYAEARRQGCKESVLHRVHGNHCTLSTR